jgi:hypothetical protein
MKKTFAIIVAIAVAVAVSEGKGHTRSGSVDIKSACKRK